MVPGSFMQRQPLLRQPCIAYGVGLWTLAALHGRAAGPGGLLYWDSFGYVGQSLTGDVGGLILGRPLFILVSHGIARTALYAGVAPNGVEPLLRVTWLAVSALAAPATAWMTAQLIASAPRTADDPDASPWRVTAPLWAGLLVALSPAAANTADAVLTDGPSMALATLGYALAAHRSASLGTALWAGVCLGAAAGLREQAIVHLPVAMVMRSMLARRRAAGLWLLAGAIPSGMLGVVWALATQADYIARLRAWFVAMAAERQQHPWTVASLGAYAVWLVSLGPLALGAMLRFWGRVARGVRPPAIAMLCIAAGSLQLAALAFYQDIAFSPRYLLAALPTGFCLPAALVLADRVRSRRALGWALAMLFVPVVAIGVGVHLRQRPLAEVLAETPTRLRTVAPNTIVVSGQACPGVVLERTTRRLAGDRVDWVQVCPGWRWPTRLATHLDTLRAEGRPLVIDLRPMVWVGARQGACRREAESYLRTHGTEPGVTVWR